MMTTAKAQWVVGPDNATCIIWAFDMFFKILLLIYVLTKYNTVNIRFKDNTITTNDHTMTMNNNNDKQWWLAGPDNAIHIIWVYTIFFH